MVLSQSTFTSVDSVRPTRFDIACVLSMLSSSSSVLRDDLPRLPLEIALHILDLAQLWLPLSSSCDDQQRITDKVNGGNVLVLLTPMIPDERELRQVFIRTISHDQGWSNWRYLHGSYSNSRTWFEGALVGLEPDDGNGNEGRMIWAEQSERVPVISNVHGSKKWKEHCVWLDSEHVLVRNARPGQRLALFARAYTPCWINFIKELEMTIYVRCP
jgi:hypothetical protein